MVRVVERRLESVDRVEFASGTVEPVDPARWSARMAAFRTDGVSVELVRTRPLRFSTREDDLVDAPLVVLAVGEGRLHGLADDRSFVVEQGSALLADSTCRITLWIEEDVRLLRIAVARDEVPGHMLLRPPMPITVLEPCPVLQASIAFASTLLRSSREEASDDDATVARAVIALQVGLLEESVRQHGRHDDELGRRARIEAHIDLHLADPGLSPTTIAEHFGLSLRSVHAAFAGSGRTVAASIRARRVEAVQRDLTGSPAMPPLTTLAVRHGFHDRTHLSRSFRELTGKVPRDWWEGARRRPS